jgi:hypothetical protein
MENNFYQVAGYESYERNGDLRCAFFKSKERAENHNLFEVDLVREILKVNLNAEDYKRYQAGQVVWFDA